MSYTLRAITHPLGVVVFNDHGGRELLIEGESCCGIGFNQLKRVASTSCRVEIDDHLAAHCRLLKPVERFP